MNKIEELKAIKKELLQDGFIIEGVFGSYARDKATKDSDIDISYRLEENFLNKYSGSVGFKRLEEIKQIISQRLNLSVDLAPKNNLSKTAKKYILKDLKYV